MRERTRPEQLHVELHAKERETLDLEQDNKPEGYFFISCFSSGILSGFIWFGFSASWLFGLVILGLFGFLAAWLFGFCLFGFTFCGFCGYGFPHPQRFGWWLPSHVSV